MKKIGLLICMLLLMGMSSVFANGMTDGVDITGKRYDASVEYKMVPPGFSILATSSRIVF